MHAVDFDSPFSAEPSASATSLTPRPQSADESTKSGASAKGFIWQNSKAAGRLKGAELYTSGPVSPAEPNRRNAAVPRSQFHQQRLATAPVSCRRGRRGGVRRALECRQIQRAER